MSRLLNERAPEDAKQDANVALRPTDRRNDQGDVNITEEAVNLNADGGAPISNANNEGDNPSDNAPDGSRTSSDIDM